MQMFRQRKYLFPVAALVLVFASCKGESPTAPTSNPPTTTIGGGTPPPATATITLAVSNPTPQVNSSSIISATVTDANNQPVPNGTAVEFDTTLGTFTEANAQTVIRTTTNGVATVTLTSALAGTATISAIVANVKKTATVAFSTIPVTPPPPDTTPLITGISPTFGAPQGGQVVTITGKNFRIPLRVLFDFGPGKTPKDATIITSTSTSIQVLTPSVDLGTTAQQLTATIKVINEAGTPNEIVVTGPTFTYQLTILTPKITILSPSSGPIDGGTRVVIYGEGFQSPVKVQFGSIASNTWQDLQVVNVLFNQITIVTPRASDVQPTGSGTLVGPVDLRVTNINSATQATNQNAFRFTPQMQITAFNPVTGSSLGGTRIIIDGNGFNDPVTVDVAGVRATVLSVSGSEIVVRTNPVPVPCSGVSAAITVTNVDNGDQVSTLPPFPGVNPGYGFTYLAVNPLITAVTPSIPLGATNATVGNSVAVTVQDPGIGPLGNAIVGFTIGGAATTPSPQQITTGTGPQTFVMPIPTPTTAFPTVACSLISGLSGTQFGPLTVEVVFRNATTGCTASAPNSLTINPPSPNTCVVPPHATLTAPPQNCPISSNLSPASVVAAGAATQTATITIANATGTQDLKIGAPVLAPSNAVGFISPNTAQTVTGGNSLSYTVTLDPTNPGADGATVTFSTNDPAMPTITVVLCGNATP